MMAAAALEEGIIDENTAYYCPGFFQIKGRRVNCWKHSGHGHIGVVDSLAFSCDVFFYNVGLELGIDRLSAWANKMGLGQETGIDLPGEISGLIPTREWKAKLHADEPVWEQNWYPGDTVNVSIGQGSVSATPLQNAVMMACVSNGGWRVRPYLNQERGPKLSERILSDKTLEIVRRGLRKCVEKDDRAPTGTGKEAKIEGMVVLGKTGSAQIMALEEHAQYATEEDIPKAKRDHAWFVAAVLDREPPIALCVLVEHGHHGSSMAAPVARKVILAVYGEEDPPAVAVAQAETR
jgi:penicillin-binding protein 2